MSRTMSQLDAAAEPVLGSDFVAISRNGNILTKVELSKLPLTDATQSALDDILSNLLTSQQIAAGAIGLAAVTANGTVLNPNGIPVAPYTDLVELTGDYTLQPEDMNKIFQASVSVNITVPSGLGKIVATFYPPSSGSLTFTPSSTNINGAATALTRSSANIAVQILPDLVTDNFRLTGI